MLYITVLIGALIYVLLELNKAIIKPDFTVYEFLKLNMFSLSLNLICGFAVVWVKDDISDIYVINKASALFLGLGGQAIFKKIYGIFTDKVGTAIGINK